VVDVPELDVYAHFVGHVWDAAFRLHEEQLTMFALTTFKQHDQLATTLLQMAARGVANSRI
jgi:hypothetical protein